MDNALLAALAANYNWQLSLIAGLGIVGLSLAGRVFRLIPTIGSAHRLNSAALAKKMEKASYAENQQWNRKWGVIYMAVIFAFILPFCLTAEPQPWWNVALDILVVLMVYDFFYYLTHRFLFHDSQFLGGPLTWVHAVHHRQHRDGKPASCRAGVRSLHQVRSPAGGVFRSSYRRRRPAPASGARSACSGRAAPAGAGSGRGRPGSTAAADGSRRSRSRRRRKGSNLTPCPHGPYRESRQSRRRAVPSVSART